MKKCYHFEWMDDYIKRLQGLGLLDSRGNATRELNPSAPTVESRELNASGTCDLDASATRELDAELKGELKKINKNLRRMIELKKQSNLIALGFYVGILALGFFYLMVITR